MTFIEQQPKENLAIITNNYLGDTEREMETEVI